jgi:hypothetical protein
MKHKAFRILIAVLVVTGGIVGASGNAYAALDTQKTNENIELSTGCNVEDIAFSAVAFGLPGIGAAYEDCLGNEQENYDKTERYGVYNSLVATEAQADSFATSQENAKSATKVAAMQRAEVAIAEAYENGSSKSVAKSKANEEIEEFYTKKQLNLIRSWNASVSAWTNAVIEYDSSVTNFANNRIDRDANPHTTSITLTNGTTVTILTINGQASNSYTIGISPNDDFRGKDWYIKAPSDSSLENKEVDSVGRYVDLFDFYDNAKNEVQTDANDLADNIYPELESGNISSSEIISRNNKVYRLATEDPQNTSFAKSLATYNSLGINSPNLTETGTITINYNNESLEGMLYTTKAPPSGKWVVGNTYNTENLGGIQLFYTTDAKEYTLKGNFTIEKISGKDTDYSSINITDTEYVVTDSNNFTKKLNRLQEVIDEYEKRQVEVGGSGGNSENGSNSQFELPNWLQEKYYGIPLWGITIVVVLGLYVIGSTRSN